MRALRWPDRIAVSMALSMSLLAGTTLPAHAPRNVNWFKKSKWVHLAKVAFEKYFLRKMRTGNSDPVYERYVLKALGIVRLVER